MRALAIAATGMSAQQTNVEVIANNIANINTTGFKRARAEFTDLLYQAERAQGVPIVDGALPVPEGVRIGLGVHTVGVRNLHVQGPLANTGNPLDVAINGRGWFQITNPDGDLLYTRAGAFNKGPNGELVTADGYLVQPAITFPANTTEIVINESGNVYAKIPNQQLPQLLGQLTLATFANDAGLEPLGNNLYRETSASGVAVIGVAAQDGYGKINQSYLENSNVDPVKEITELISAQRAYEMNSKVIQAADEMARHGVEGNPLMAWRAAALVATVLFVGWARPAQAETLADIAAAARASMEQAAPSVRSSTSAPAVVDEISLPVPVATIHAGDIITDAMLQDRAVSTQMAERYPIATNRSALVGKVARRMLTAGNLVPLNAVTDAKVVTRGVPATIRFEEGGLVIRSIATPLESGTAGAVIRLKNIDSGQVVTGVVQSDGTVKVGG